MITRRHLICAFAIAPLAVSPVFAGCSAVFGHQGVAINGFDPVGYFDEEAPVEGTDVHRLMWRNAIWRFASLRNMSLFERNPNGFAPQYGGYCAMSLSQGRLSETLPDAWAIHGDKLYLTHSVAARDRWQQDAEAFIAKADLHWSTSLCS